MRIIHRRAFLKTALATTLAVSGGILPALAPPRVTAARRRGNFHFEGVDYQLPSAGDVRLHAERCALSQAASRPLLAHLPIRLVESSSLDTADGVEVWCGATGSLGQRQRGLGGAPQRSPAPGDSGVVLPARPLTALSLYNPFLGSTCYGEYLPVTHEELRWYRQSRPGAEPVDLTHLVFLKVDILVARRFDRIDCQGWQLLTWGGPWRTGPTSRRGRTFQRVDRRWSSIYANPFRDLAELARDARSEEAAFDHTAIAYLTSDTLASMATCPAVLHRAGLPFPEDAGSDSLRHCRRVLNTILAECRLPRLCVYDAGGLDDSGGFHTFLPRNMVVVVAAPTDGNPVGSYQVTRNANNHHLAAGSYTQLLETPTHEAGPLQVHDGHNGAAVISRPAAVAVLDVARGILDGPPSVRQGVA